MRTFFTSDTHFGHANIIKYCNRPYKSVEQMNEDLILRWNSVVQPGDRVYHLGDFCMGRRNQPKIWVPRLNGHIHFIRGNHDPHIEGQGFASTQYYKELKIEGKKIILLHYPMRTWNGSHRGSWHLFGHVHGTMTVQYGRKTLDDCLAMDAGVDCHDYYPISFEQVKKIFEAKEVELAERFKKDSGGKNLSNKERKFRKRMASL
jgi:calcineurin-like phosphoesterase family protein